eukprot:CAMPEP_0184339728 /NCGR_PEP_ID=MMETSP1089-20130417/8408_1 /TAXON_ID=38269 ORGANISM="Gloeochaete wittrockiana, Strain SAG46.84" /NCGR_SAMPLE_ID=MMETSP1089 /ASSEMBLY_ACC=CAM_ASM_000445 /LENGTH=48 /DNA_ID= /DNA_START= /DNA_END= /DNA_ORIENTATION=
MTAGSVVVCAMMEADAEALEFALPLDALVVAVTADWLAVSEHDWSSLL